MSDMLVRLYDLSEGSRSAREGDSGVRRALVLERPIVGRWVAERFPIWHAEVDASFCRLPVACFVAVRDGQILGFVCYDTTFLNFLGPIGVAEDARGQGLGRALLLAGLEAMRQQGYAYAVIGWAGPEEFFSRAVGATVIPGSAPGAYKGALRAPDEASSASTPK